MRLVLSRTDNRYSWISIWQITSKSLRVHLRSRYHKQISSLFCDISSLTIIFFSLILFNTFSH